MNDLEIGGATVLLGDCIDRLRGLSEKSVQVCVTSPPYFGLRDYGHEGQLGLETTPDLYVVKMVAVFSEVRRVLADDGTLWLNIGDSYGKAKQLLGVPWLLAFALQADGWVLRQDIIWHKPNPMPESVRDRCTKAHEYIFLLSKSQRYSTIAKPFRSLLTLQAFEKAGEFAGPPMGRLITRDSAMAGSTLCGTSAMSGACPTAHIREHTLPCFRQL